MSDKPPSWTELTSSKLVALLPCPFCGRALDITDHDTLYPSGSGWKTRPNGSRSYHRAGEVPPEQWCYAVHCHTSSGGCGAEVSGDSAAEAVWKWNQRCHTLNELNALVAAHELRHRVLTDAEIHDCFQQAHRNKTIERRAIYNAIIAALKGSE